MTDFRASVLIDLGGNLVARARRYGDAFNRLGQTGQRSMRGLRGAAATAGRSIDQLGNRYVALATGAVGVATVRNLLSLDQRLVRLGIQSNKTGGEMDTLKDRIFEVAQAPDIRADPSELLSAVETIVEKTGDLDFALANLDNIGRAMSGSGGQGSFIGALTAEFRKFGIVAPEAIEAALDTLITQGKAGSFTVGNLASQGERLVSAYAATGRVGPGAVRELGAIIQVIRSGTGSAEQATTAFEAVLRTLQDADKIADLQGKGIQIFEPDQPGVMRSIADIMTDIIKATGGDLVKISSVFDAEAMRAFSSAAGEFKNTGAIASLEKFLAIQGDGSQLVADSARAAESATAAYNSLATAFQRVADQNLAGPIQAAAGALNSLEPETVNRLLAAAGAAGLGVGALALGKRYGGGLVGGLFSRRGPGGPNPPGGKLGGMRVSPVYVTNWPAGFAGGGAGGRRRRGGRGGKAAGFRYFPAATAAGAAATPAATASRSLLGLGSKALRYGGRGLPALAALLATGEAVAALSDSGATVEQKGEAIGGAGGALAGGLAGAALGSAILPVIGTAIGGLIGSLAGQYGGGELGELIGRLTSGEGAAGEAPNGNVNVRLEIDQRGQVTPSSIETFGSGIDLDVDAGPTFVGG